jgi:pimeloyl-ACP methyl ester carboxylesterase
LYIEVNNINIHYEVLGNGKPIILLNPNSVNTGLMKFIANKLKNKYKVYIFDRRCCGKSEKKCNLTYEESAKDVAEFIKKLNIDKPYLLGCSGGGTVALNVAIHYQTSISKLVLCSGVARNNIIEKPNYAKIMEKIPWYPGKKNNEMFEKLNYESHSITEEELQKIVLPTLVFNGGNKDIVPRNEAEYIANNINNSKLYILEKAGHCNYIFNNQEFYDELFDFLK